MNHKHLKKWRDLMGLSRDEASSALGIAPNTYSNYERGIRYEQEGKQEVKIPKTVELACAALVLGIKKYNGEKLEF